MACTPTLAPTSRLKNPIAGARGRRARQDAENSDIPDDARRSGSIGAPRAPFADCESIQNIPNRTRAGKSPDRERACARNRNCRDRRCRRRADAEQLSSASRPSVVARLAQSSRSVTELKRGSQAQRSACSRLGTMTLAIERVLAEKGMRVGRAGDCGAEDVVDRELRGRLGQAIAAVRPANTAQDADLNQHLQHRFEIARREVVARRQAILRRGDVGLVLSGDIDDGEDGQQATRRNEGHSRLPVHFAIIGGGNLIRELRDVECQSAASPQSRTFIVRSSRNRRHSARCLAQRNGDGKLRALRPAL